MADAEPHQETLFVEDFTGIVFCVARLEDVSYVCWWGGEVREEDVDAECCEVYLVNEEVGEMGLGGYDG